MTKWARPQEELPQGLECGDRIVIIVHEVLPGRKKASYQLVILEATEDGWYSPDETYAGYSIHDGILWATERSVCLIAHFAEPNIE